MFHFNGRIASLKRLFSIETYSLGNRQYHVSVVNLKKDAKKQAKNDTKYKEATIVHKTVKNLGNIKNFSFIQIDSAARDENKAEIIHETKVLNKPESSKILKNEMISESESAVDKLKRLLNKLDSKSNVENLMEPLEKINSRDQSPKKGSNLKEKRQKNNNEGLNNLKKIIENTPVLGQLGTNEENFKKISGKESTGKKFNKSKKGTGKESIVNTRSIIQEIQIAQRNASSISPKKESPTNEIHSISKIIANENLAFEIAPKESNSSDIYSKSHKLNEGIGLNLFENSQLVENIYSPSESPIWKMHYCEELTEAQDIPPINGFDEMVMLTNEGKLWTFPIDNEQGMDESEAETPFQDYVFLDNYLEQFPDIEPVQEFMTLVLNGLSKNSFISLSEKKDIITWYKNYFNEKEDLIQEALESEKLEYEYRKNIEFKSIEPVERANLKTIKNN